MIIIGGATATGKSHVAIALAKAIGGELISFAQEAIQTGNRSAITPLAQRHPEHHQTGILVAPQHIQDKFDLLRCVLIGMAVRAVGTICLRTQSSVIFLAPTIDVLSARLVAFRYRSYSILKGILYCCLLKPHILCYLIHSE